MSHVLKPRKSTSLYECSPNPASPLIRIDLGAVKTGRFDLIGEVRSALEAALRDFDRTIPARQQIAPPVTPQWLWFEKVRFGRLTIFTGDEESDLHGLAARMAATVSRGLEWPDSHERCEQGHVIVLAKLFAIENERLTFIQGNGRRCRLDVAAKALVTLHSSTKLVLVLWRLDYVVGCTFPDLLDIFEGLAALASANVAVVLVDVDGTLSEPGRIADALSCTRGRDICEVRGGWEIERKLRSRRWEAE